MRVLSSGSRNLVSIKVQSVIQAFKKCSKWQESLGGQFVFSWGALFMAFSFPQGNKGNQLQLVEDYESHCPLTPAVGVTGGFQKRATIAIEYNSASRRLLLNCLAINPWIVPAHHRRFSRTPQMPSSAAHTEEQEENNIIKHTERQCFGDCKEVVDIQLTSQHH